MTAVVSNAQVQSSLSRLPKGSGGLADGDGVGSEGFRELLAKLTAVDGGEGNAGETDAEGKATVSYARTAAWQPNLGDGLAVPPVMHSASGVAGAEVPAQQQTSASAGGAAGDAAAARGPATDAIGQAMAAIEEPVLETVADGIDAPEPGADSADLPTPEREQAQAPLPPVSMPKTPQQETAAGSNVVAQAAAAAAAGRALTEVAGGATRTLDATSERTRKPQIGSPPSLQRNAPATDTAGDARPTLDAEPAPDRVPTLSMGAQVEAPQGDVAAVKETRLTVLRNETHFAPVPQPSPLLQISERISAEIETLPASTPAFADAARPHAKTTSESVLKVLHIQLQPAELGTVTVRMSLRDDVLELSLDASEQSTAQQIQKDHEALSTALRSAGYLVEGVTVKVVESDKTQPALQTNFQGAQTSGQSSAQSSSSWSQPDGRSGREQPAAQDRSGDASAWQDVGGDRQGAGGSGGVYV